MGILSTAAAAEQQWSEFVAMLLKVAPNHLPLPQQVAEVKAVLHAILDKRYDQALIRRRDLEQLEQISTNFRSRSVMLTDLALDPPSATQDLAGPPLREEDFLILSTIHSAKGCEWDAVYVIHAADGNIPSDMATGSEEEIEEERRLFYVGVDPLRRISSSEPVAIRMGYSVGGVNHIYRVPLAALCRVDGREDQKILFAQGWAGEILRG